MSTPPNTLGIALDYVALNPRRYISPITAGAKFPPKLRDMLDSNASNDPEQIKKWSAKWPGCNWLVAHKKSRIFVVDVDTNVAKGKTGQQTYDLLDLEFGFPETETTTTPSGGKHLIYEGEHIFALGEHGLGKDIDSPGYTLIPGCVLKDGSRYVGNDKVAVPCPQWIYDKLKRAKTRVADAGEAVVDLDKPDMIAWAIDYLTNDAEPAIEGSGGDFTTLKVAMSLRDNGLSQPMAEQLMVEHFNSRCEPSWSAEDLAAKVANAYSYATLSKVGGKTAEADFADDDVLEVAASIETVGTPKSIGRQKAAREKAAAREAAKPESERERLSTLVELQQQWVWVGTLNRFINRANPEIIYNKEGFNDAFRYIDQKKKISDLLFSKKKDTIARPHKLTYQPTRPEFVDGNWNQWRPSAIVAKQGDTQLWDAHLAYLFPDAFERGLLLDWLAGVLQGLESKPMHALLLIGKIQGTGKSFIARVLAALIGESNWQALTQDILANGFTGWATRTKLVTVEELRAVNKTEIAKKLHPWISQKEITVNEKNLPTFRIEQVIAFLFMSNKDDAIQVDNTDRRYLVLRTLAKPHAGGNSYYRKLYGRRGKGGLLQNPEALGAILHQLMTRDLSKCDIEGPAPDTAAKSMLKAAAANDIGQWITQHSGQPPYNLRVVTIDEIIESLPGFMKSRISMGSVREALEHVGGIPWPDQIRPGGRNGPKLRVWLLNDAANTHRAGDIPDVLTLYREDHGPNADRIAPATQAIGKGELTAMTDFGNAADDFGPDEPPHSLH